MKHIFSQESENSTHTLFRQENKSERKKKNPSIHKGIILFTKVGVGLESWTRKI